LGNKENEYRYALGALLLTLIDHATGIQQAIEEVRDVYNAVIQVCLHWRNGIIQPQVLPPSRLIQILKISRDSFLCYLEVPVVLSKAYACVLFDIVSVDVYLVENNLVCTVKVLLLNAFCVQSVQINTISHPNERYGREIHTYATKERDYCYRQYYIIHATSEQKDTCTQQYKGLHLKKIN
jgi:hypothetical protein